ncbi:MAG: nicotinate phosphoribosyltransferase [Phycisphaera sp.]|nr:nicotinate phosphoribosyltransferase [Phycisphaera sp.]
MTLSRVYSTSLALLTDLYQLTMAYGYWKLGRAEERAAFHLFYRRNPFGGGYAIVAGLDYVIDYLDGLRFTDDDLAYVADLRGNDDRPLFDAGFIDYLRTMTWELDVDAMPEGTAAFPHEPLVRVVGPLPQCQIVETPLLTMINFQTLIATKSSRIARAARGEPVLEFGLRRAQGIDGGLSASRAAYIGGAAVTSNVLAGRLFGIPVKGTHAHSWVMSFDDELEAFTRYADAMPNNCVFLVDTYDTLTGVANAIDVARRLRDNGHAFVGIRLDSGDMTALSRDARRMLDDAGLEDAAIVGSNDLDEYLIDAHKRAGGRVNVWGVGTRLVTAHDQPALGGVYKIAAIRHTPDAAWQYTLKLSEEPAKVSNPGVQQVRRYVDRGDNGRVRFTGDMIYDTLSGEPDTPTVVDIATGDKLRQVPADTPHEDLLVPIFRGGCRVYVTPDLADVRRRAMDQLAALDDDVLRFTDAAPYTVGLEAGLYETKARLMADARRAAENARTP